MNTELEKDKERLNNEFAKYRKKIKILAFINVGLTIGLIFIVLIYLGKTDKRSLVIGAYISVGFAALTFLFSFLLIMMKASLLQKVIDEKYGFIDD